MKRLILLSVALLSLLSALPVTARQAATDPDVAKTEAVRAFEQILDLWHAADFDHLYDKTTVSGKDTKEWTGGGPAAFARGEKEECKGT